MSGVGRSCSCKDAVKHYAHRCELHPWQVDISALALSFETLTNDVRALRVAVESHSAPAQETGGHSTHNYDWSQWLTTRALHGAGQDHTEPGRRATAPATDQEVAEEHGPPGAGTSTETMQTVRAFTFEVRQVRRRLESKIVDFARAYRLAQGQPVDGLRVLNVLFDALSQLEHFEDCWDPQP